MWMLEVTTSFMWPVNWEGSEGERMGVWDSEECYLDPYQVAVGDWLLVMEMRHPLFLCAPLLCYWP